MRFVLRADALRRSGSGHVTRIIAIAEELLSRGLYVVFIGHTEEIPWVTELVTSTGFSEIHTTEKSFIPNKNTDFLILDSYEIPIDSYFISQVNWLKVVILVDSHTPHYRADIQIQLSLKTPRTFEGCEVIKISGPEFFPIRKSLRLKGFPKQPNSIPRILVTTGGSEIENLVDRFIIALSAINLEFFAEILSNRILQLKLPRFHLSQIGPDYNKKLVNVDGVITSSGVSSLEIAANKIPMAVYSAVDNQRENYSLLTSSGYAIGIGEFDIHGGRVEIDALSNFIGSLMGPNQLTYNQKINLDFDGSKRIVDLILGFQ